jgi:acyl dehydratase
VNYEKTVRIAKPVRGGTTVRWSFTVRKLDGLRRITLELFAAEIELIETDRLSSQFRLVGHEVI